MLWKSQGTSKHIYWCPTIKMSSSDLWKSQGTSKHIYWCPTIKWAALTHWGRLTHICVSKLTIIGSHNGLPPGRRQAIIWTNAGIFLTGPSGTNFSEILIQIHRFSLKKMHSKTSSSKWRPFCLGLNEVIYKNHRLPVKTYTGALPSNEQQWSMKIIGYQ